MLFNKLKTWLDNSREIHRNKEKERIKSVILSLLLTDRYLTLTHLEQAEILSDVVKEFKKRKQQESILCSNTILELERTASLLR